MFLPNSGQILSNSAKKLLKIQPNLLKSCLTQQKIYTLTKFANRKGGKSLKPSDHNILTCEFNIKINQKIPEVRREIFNLKNSECQIKFKELTKKQVKQKLNAAWYNLRQVQKNHKKLIHKSSKSPNFAEMFERRWRKCGRRFYL